MGESEILAAGVAIDECKDIQEDLQILLKKTIELWISVIRKDLYMSLSTQRYFIKTYIRSDFTIFDSTLKPRQSVKCFGSPEVELYQTLQPSNTAGYRTHSTRH